MGRLNQADQKWVAHLTNELRTVRLDSHDLWSTFLPALKEALRATVPVAYGLRLTEGGARVAFIEGGLSPRARAQAWELFDANLEKGRDFAAFNPIRVERAQRNKVKMLVELDGGASRNHWKQLGLEGLDQLRVLACEGDSLLAWVGAFRSVEDPFTHRERLLLQQVTPALRGRLEFDRRMQSTPLVTAALETCLEALARAAFVVNRTAQVQFANTLARRLMARDGSTVTDRLQRSLRGEPVGLQATPLRLPGAPPHYLVIEQPPPANLSLLLAEATKRWALTPREAQALELLAEGLSNLAIASRLSCAERTAEVHIGRLLAKSNSVSRSQLIARFWNCGQLEEELKSAHVSS